MSNGEEIEVSDPDINRALIACMDMAAVLGGAASHYGGPAAFAEINSVIYGYAFHQAQSQNKKWSDLFHFVNDAGHCENGIYAIKANYGFADLSLDSLKKFRSIESPLTGHGEAHLFPEGVLISNGPLGSGVAQAQGLAIGDALAENKERVTVLSLSDGGAMEGEAKEALSSIAGLAQKRKVGPFICILSDNNTKLSGRIDEDSFSMSGYFSSMSEQGWHVLNLNEGNQLEDCLQVFEKAVSLAKENPTKPVFIHAKTVKGIGTKATAESASGGHGFPLKKAEDLRAFVEEILGEKETPAFIDQWISELESPKKSTSSSTEGEVKKEKIQVGVAQALIKARQSGLPVVSVSSDLAGSTGVAAFQKEFPEASIDIGIAESNMVSVGSGLSLSGFIPVVDTFAQFGSTKGALPFIMSSLSQAPMIAIFSHIGFQDAADGASHQALSYMAMLNSIPNIKTISLTCSHEAEALVSQAIEEFNSKKEAGKTPPSYVFFLGRENFPQYYLKEQNYELGKSQVLRKAGDSNLKICLIAVGSLLPQALEAAEQLSKKGIECSVVNPSIMNEVDGRVLEELMNCDAQAIVIEEHQELGGYHSVLSQRITMDNIPAKLKSLSVKGKFGQSAYKAIELYKAHRLDATAIIDVAENWNK
jgi:transketolase